VPVTMTVNRINITPVKGTALQHPPAVQLDAGGVFANRRFYLIDDDGRLRNGKQLGKLVQLRSALDTADTADAINHTLSITLPDGQCVRAAARADGESVTTNFYGRPVRGRLVSGPWNEAISRHAGQALRLVQAADDEVACDVHPVTLVSQATMALLRTRARGPEAHWAERFRMLFELEGPAAFEEDGWTDRRLAIGDAIIRIIGPVPRCPVTGQDPATGERDFGTLQALHAIRDPGNPDAEPAAGRYPATVGMRLMLGMYARVERTGEVRAGSPVTLLD